MGRHPVIFGQLSAAASNDHFTVTIVLMTGALAMLGWISRQVFYGMRDWKRDTSARFDVLENKINEQQHDLTEIKAYQRGYRDGVDLAQGHAASIGTGG